MFFFLHSKLSTNSYICLSYDLITLQKVTQSFYKLWFFIVQYNIILVLYVLRSKGLVCVNCVCLQMYIFFWCCRSYYVLCVYVCVCIYRSFSVNLFNCFNMLWVWCCYFPSSRCLGSDLLLGRDTLPVVQYVMKILIFCELNLPPQGVSGSHISLVLHGCLSVSFSVKFEPLPQPEGWRTKKPFLLLIFLRARAVAEVVVLGGERVLWGELGVGHLPLLGLPAEG